MEEEEDRISTLPDEILHHILSLLPSSQIPLTSLLSKRWNPLWLSMPNADRISALANSILIHILSFLPSSQHLLAATSLSKRWRLLRLTIPSLQDSEDDDIDDDTRRDSLYLVVLKLNAFTMDFLTSTIHFPSLKILHLRGVHFLKLEYLIHILSSCPLLVVLLMKNLQVTDDNLATAPELNLKPFPKLVRVDISDSSICLPLKSFYNVQFLRARVVQTEDFSATKFFNLTYMDLSFLEYYWHWLIKLLCKCPSLQNLVIDKIGDYGLSDDRNWLHPGFIPECLSSQLKMFSFRNYGGKESELQFTKYIFQNGTVLRNARIYVSISRNGMERFQMMQELLLCQMGSNQCQLHFN